MTEQSPSSRPSIFIDEEFVDEIARYIQSGQDSEVLDLVRDVHPSDLEQILRRLPHETASTLFDWLPDTQAGPALTEMESAQRRELLEEWEPVEIAAALDEVNTDDAADVLADLSAGVAEQVLPRLEDGAEIENLLTFGADTAGGLMETDLVSVSEKARVGEVTEELRRLGRKGRPGLLGARRRRQWPPGRNRRTEEAFAHPD